MSLVAVSTGMAALGAAAQRPEKAALPGSSAAALAWLAGSAGSLVGRTSSGAVSELVTWAGAVETAGSLSLGERGRAGALAWRVCTRAFVPSAPRYQHCRWVARSTR